MVMGTQLASVNVPDDKIFDAQFIDPLISTGLNNLFEQNSIRTINSRTLFIEAFGDIEIPLGGSYDDDIGIKQIANQIKERGRPACPRGQLPKMMHGEHTTLRSYFEFQDKNLGSSHSRVNFSIPPAMREHFSVPSICYPRIGEEPETLGAFLIGNEGSFSHLHFDKDGRHGLLYQVYGSKLVIVFPYEATQKLMPFTQFSSWCIQSMGTYERQRFLNYTGGLEIVLKPGDSVFLPAYCWHYADYLEDCGSINLRFRRPDRLAWLSKNFFPDRFIQGLARALLDSKLGNELWAIARSRLHQLDHLRGDARFIAIRSLACELHREFRPAEHSPAYSVDLEDFFPCPLQHLVDTIKKA